MTQATATNVYEPLALTPLPVVIELDPVHGWIAWDCAVEERDELEALEGCEP